MALIKTMAKACKEGGLPPCFLGLHLISTYILSDKIMLLTIRPTRHLLDKRRPGELFLEIVTTHLSARES
jgi:hypothetical protein